jgi:hypothetical protein
LAFLPAQSLLRRAATLETRPAAKATLLIAALSAGGHPDRLTLTSALNAIIAASIKPDVSLASQKPLIARALVLAGRYDLAAAWYAKPADDADFHSFQVLLDIAAPNAVRDAAAQNALSWFAATAVPQQNPAPAAALALGLSDVLGRAMPPEAKTLATAWEGVREEGSLRRPSSDDMSKLEAAASQPERKGEMALRILDIVGANGPFDLPADVIIECVRILQQAGLTDDARRLAVEALATAAQ